MAGEDFYRVYCETEGKMVYAWSQEKLTACPNNAGHTIKANSVTQMRRVGWVRLGEAAAIRDVLHIGADGRYYKALASDPSKMPAACFALRSGNENSYVSTSSVWALGGFSNLTTGASYYVSPTVPGAITDDNVKYAGNRSQKVGEALSSTRLRVGFQAVEETAELPQIQWSSNNACSFSGVWTKLGSFIFPGYSICKTPVSCRYIGWVVSGGTGEFRLFDLTNNEVICTGEAFDNVDPEVFYISPLNSIPQNAAVWEVQVRRTAGGLFKRIYVDCVQLC